MKFLHRTLLFSLSLSLLFSASVFAQTFLNIADFGGVVNDGAPDDDALRKAFEEALQVHAAGVFLPAGNWHFEQSIFVPRGMTLKGSYTRPHVAEKEDLEGAGTTIECYVGKISDAENIEKNPWEFPSCVYLQGSSTLEGVNIVYPEQTDPLHPMPYAWTIFCNSAYDANQEPTEAARCAVINSTLVNSYAGIFMAWASNDHLIRGVNMAVFKKGIVLDGVTSLGVIENVNIHNQYSWAFYQVKASDAEKTTAFAKRDLENLTGIEIHRADWGWLSNIFVIYAKTGFVFSKSLSADSSQWEMGTRALPSLDLVNVGCDLCDVAIQADYVNSGIGVNFTNGNFLGRVLVGDDSYGSIRFTNSFFSFGIAAKDSLADQFQIGRHATLQMTNSEVLTFPAGVPLWRGSIFRNRGILQLNNTILAVTDTNWFDMGQFVHLKSEENGIATVQNIVGRGVDFRFKTTEKGRIRASGIEFDTANRQYNPPK